LGCPFFKWEKEYIEHVESLKKEGMGFSQHLMPQEQASASNGKQDVESKEHKAAVGMKKERDIGVDVDLVKHLQTLVRTGDNLVRLMQLNCFMALCITLLLFLILVVITMKV
jgi:hypothetical protein